MVLSPCWIDAELEASSARYGLEETTCLEDPEVREAIVDDVAVTPGQDQTRIAEHREVLAHIGDVATDAVGQIPNGQLALTETLKDAQPLGVCQSPGYDGGPLLRCLEIAQFEHVDTLQQLAQLRK